jgi:hypothetical protein
MKKTLCPSGDYIPSYWKHYCTVFHWLRIMDPEKREPEQEWPLSKHEAQRFCHTDQAEAQAKLAFCLSSHLSPPIKVHVFPTPKRQGE